MMKPKDWVKGGVGNPAHMAFGASGSSTKFEMHGVVHVFYAIIYRSRVGVPRLIAEWSVLFVRCHKKKCLLPKIGNLVSDSIFKEIILGDRGSRFWPSDGRTPSAYLEMFNERPLRADQEAMKDSEAHNFIAITSPRLQFFEMILVKWVLHGLRLPLRAWFDDLDILVSDGSGQIVLSPGRLQGPVPVWHTESLSCFLIASFTVLIQELVGLTFDESM